MSAAGGDAPRDSAAAPPDAAALLSGFAELDTPSVSDALDRLNLAGACEGIRPLFPGARTVGRAFTVAYRAAGDPPGTVGDFIDDVAAGQVVVIANEGRTDCTVWGDLLTLVALSRGIAGTVIDGVCRDVPSIVESGYPLFSRGSFMRTGKDRVEVAGVEVTVSFAGIDVAPGDIIVGDDSGVVVVPQGGAVAVLEVAQQVAAAEARIEAGVRAGLSLREAREQEGYHVLQRRGEGR
jgi:4-hydroxy-4-methyl-2-oxoglutarate aldolase